MNITKLTSQVKNPDRVNVFVDNKYAFSLTVAQVVDERIKVGLALDDQMLEKLKELSFDGKLYMQTLNWALLRPRSKKECREYVYRKLQTVDTSRRQTKIDDILALLEKQKYINDEHFVAWWLDRRSRKKHSTTQLKNELITKGIERELIDSLLEHRDEREALALLMEKLRTKPRYAQPDRLLRYLVVKGYPYSLVKELLATGKGSDADDV